MGGTKLSAAGPRPRPALQRELLGYLLAALVLTWFIRSFVVESFNIPSQSMQPLLQAGDRVLVSHLSFKFDDIQPGDVIVFTGEGSFGTDSGVHFVKRVIGLPGDQIQCCDRQGRIIRNGFGIDEPYLYSGDAPSEQEFSVEVPAGRLWVMGDHRSDSADSRAHLGDPGGGMVPQDQVVGKVILRYWPPTRLSLIHRAAATFGAAS